MPTVRNGDANLYYDVMGDGPPVVMVYGLGGHGRQWWRDFPRLLAERYRLVILDNRGTGHSSMPEEPWTMTDMTGDIAAVAGAAGLDSFHLLGCSLGTLLSRHFVKERGGERLHSLSLLCPPNGISATQEDLNAALFWDRTKPLIESAEKSWPIVHPEPWIPANRQVLIADFEENLRNPTPPRTYQFQLKAAEAAGDPNDALNAFDWPVLVMHGTIDRLVPFENAKTLVEAVPRARLAALEGRSHNFWQHDPAESARTVLEFLDAAESGVGAK